jgi:hypothetical protein
MGIFIFLKHKINIVYDGISLKMEELKITKKSQELYMAAFCGNYENSLREGWRKAKNFCLYICFEVREDFMCFGKLFLSHSITAVYAAKYIIHFPVNLIKFE